jgi:hypothetical protein
MTTMPAKFESCFNLDHGTISQVALDGHYPAAVCPDDPAYSAENARLGTG